jgi:protein-S-isoprenylcysteine O-methyltransferase Ste14
LPRHLLEPCCPCLRPGALEAPIAHTRRRSGCRWYAARAGLGLPVLGGALVCLGLVLMVATIRLFMTVGKGTLAPWNPPQRLVVRGVYRYVRNPMISGACCLLLGEAVLAASLPLLGLFALAVIVNAVYIPLSEEPGLAKRFGEEYEVYRRNVPRWIVERCRPCRGMQPSFLRA